MKAYCDKCMKYTTNKYVDNITDIVCKCARCGTVRKVQKLSLIGHENSYCPKCKEDTVGDVYTVDNNQKNIFVRCSKCTLKKVDASLKLILENSQDEIAEYRERKSRETAYQMEMAKSFSKNVGCVVLFIGALYLLSLAIGKYPLFFLILIIGIPVLLIIVCITDSLIRGFKQDIKDMDNIYKSNELPEQQEKEKDK